MSPIVPPAPASPRPTRNASLLGDERGATAIEYGLIAALMAIVIITGLQALGGQTGALYGVIDTITVAIEAALNS
jgi:pilus assembly protein Flp/PilA